MRGPKNNPDLLSEEIIIGAIGEVDSALDVVEKREDDLTPSRSRWISTERR